MAAKNNIVAQCIYRPKPEEVVWGALAGLAKDLGPDYVKYFPEKQSGSVEEALDAYEQTLRTLEDQCKIPIRTLVAKSIRAYCRSIDRYSDYDDYQTWKKIQEARKFDNVGIGVTLVERVGEGFLLYPFPDGPGERAGITAGDFLLEVNDVSVRGMSKAEVVSICAGKAGTQVMLKVQHTDATVESIAVVREKVITSPLKVDQTASGLRVAFREISEKAVEDFHALLRSRRPGEEMTIDFRGCGVGTVSAAVKMASLFLPADSVIGKLETVNGQEKLLSANKTPFRPSKLIILQDRYTASSAEVVIAALVGNRVVPVETRGERTYGKGVTEMQIEITADVTGTIAGILVITDTRIYGPNNEVWDGDGLVPTSKQH